MQKNNIFAILAAAFFALIFVSTNNSHRLENTGGFFSKELVNYNLTSLGDEDSADLCIDQSFQEAICTSGDNHLEKNLTFIETEQSCSCEMCTITCSDNCMCLN